MKHLGQEIFALRPEKYQWFAINRDGKGFLYSHKPKCVGNFWFSNEYKVDIGPFVLGDINFMDTLIKREQ